MRHPLCPDNDGGPNESVGCANAALRHAPRRDMQASVVQPIAGQSIRSAIVFVVVVISLTGIPSRSAMAEDTSEAFLKQLRAGGYQQMALKFLDRLDTEPGVAVELKSAVAFEKAQVYFDLAKSERNPDKRQPWLEQTESSLQEFLTQDDHPKKGEAELQLASLQIIRGEQLMRVIETLDGDDPAELETKRKDAREAFLAASKTYDLIVARLRDELVKMRGAKLDPAKDSDAIAQRDSFRAQFLRGLSSSAQAKKLAAETYKNPAAEGKKLLEDAMKAFEELSEKYQNYLQGVSAIRSLGEIQEALGQRNEANASYASMLDMGDIDELRPDKFRSATGMIRLALSDSPPKPNDAINLAKPYVDAIRPNEQSLSETLDLRLQLSKAYLARSVDSETNAADKKRSKSDARKLLAKIAKIPGSHVDPSKALLAEMGINLKDDDKPNPIDIEAPKSFAEAIDAARVLLATANSLAQSIQALEESNNLKEIQSLENEFTETNQKIVELLRLGLPLTNQETDLEEIYTARQLMAYASLRNENFRDAIAVGGFLALSAQGSELGLSGGMIAVNAYQQLLSKDDQNKFLAGQFRRQLAELEKGWPENTSVQKAKGILVELAFKNERWDEAASEIDAMADGPNQTSLNRLFGQLLYADSVEKKVAGDDTASNELLDRAVSRLSKGFKDANFSLADDQFVKARVTFAKALIKKNRMEEARGIIDDPKNGAIELAKRLNMNDSSFRGDLHSTELRLVVDQMSSAEGDPKKLMPRAVGAIGKLQTAYKGNPERLSNLLLSIATDIEGQIESAPPLKKQKLTTSFGLFLGELSSISNDVAILKWIGATETKLAEQLSSQQGGLTPESKKMLENAIAAFEKANEFGDATVAQKFQLAHAKRLAGQYKGAIDDLEGLLKENPLMIQAQIEAAFAYEQWAATVPKRIQISVYKAALSGGRPSGPKKQNVIWGWGKISKRTNGRKEFREKFFNARYHISLCRFLQGKSSGDKEYFKKSRGAIENVLALYPDMGGKESWDRFDKLLRQVQAAEGLPVTGLEVPAPQAK